MKANILAFSVAGVVLGLAGPSFADCGYYPGTKFYGVGSYGSYLDNVVAFTIALQNHPLGRGGAAWDQSNFGYWVAYDSLATTNVWVEGGYVVPQWWGARQFYWGYRAHDSQQAHFLQANNDSDGSYRHYMVLRAGSPTTAWYAYMDDGNYNWSTLGWVENGYSDMWGAEAGVETTCSDANVVLGPYEFWWRLAKWASTGEYYWHNFSSNYFWSAADTTPPWSNYRPFIGSLFYEGWVRKQ